jgi:glycosyltransferase involved in cell wall biosynthesis
LDRYRVGIIIPAFNESATIGEIVQKAMRYGVVIVIDDASSDKTRDIALDNGAIVVSNSQNMGYDYSLCSGFEKAYESGCEYIITLDADGQHDPELIAQMIIALDNGADLVVGIRNTKQRFSEFLYCWISSWKWGIKDPLCGMKAYRVKIYSDLGHFDSYNSIGTELMIYAARNNKNISQIPIISGLRIDQPRFGNSVLANFKILRSLCLSLIKF